MTGRVDVPACLRRGNDPIIVPDAKAYAFTVAFQQKVGIEHHLFAFQFAEDQRSARCCAKH